jgi:hypothetical protein
MKWDDLGRIRLEGSCDRLSLGWSLWVTLVGVRYVGLRVLSELLKEGGGRSIIQLNMVKTISVNGICLSRLCRVKSVVEIVWEGIWV